VSVPVEIHLVVDGDECPDIPVSVEFDHGRGLPGTSPCMSPWPTKPDATEPTRRVSRPR